MNRLRILFVAPNAYHALLGLGNKTNPRQVGPPYGTLLLAAIAEKMGHEVAFIDPGVYDDWNFFVSSLSAKARTSNIIGFNTTYPTISSDAKEIRLVRKSNRDALIICGGYFATFQTKLLLRNTDTNIVIRGEAETAFREVLKTLAETDCFRNPLNSKIATELKRIPGVACKFKTQLNSHGIIESDKILSISEEEWESLPLPSWHLAPLETYSKHWGKMFVGYMTSRGCVGRCKFCSVSHFSSNNIRYLSTAKIIRDLVQTRIAFPNLEQVFFVDECFTMNRKRTLRLCNRLLEAKRSGKLPDNLSFACETRVDTIDPGLLGTMAKTGFEEIWYGFESGSDRMLESWAKDTTCDKNRRAIDVTVGRKIRPVGFFILGSPSCKLNDIISTLELVVYLFELGGKPSPDFSYVVIPFNEEILKLSRIKYPVAQIQYTKLVFEMEDHSKTAMKELNLPIGLFPADLFANVLLRLAYLHKSHVGTITSLTNILCVFEAFKDLFVTFPETNRYRSRIKSLFNRLSESAALHSEKNNEEDENLIRNIHGSL